MARPLAEPLEAAVLSCGTNCARVRVLATREELTVRARDLWHVMPGHVVTLALERRWRHRGQLYAVGDMLATRIDAQALELPRLQIHERPPVAMDDADHAETDTLRELMARIAASARSTYEMEQVLPAVGSSNDPILESIERKKRGDRRGAVHLLMEALRCDLRCLDAHMHLGNSEFPAYPEHARLHYQIGVAIGDHAEPCGGLTSTTGRSCDAFMAWGSRSGGSDTWRRRSGCSSGCSGSTLPTNKARVGTGWPCGQERPGARRTRARPGAGRRFRLTDLAEADSRTSSGPWAWPHRSACRR